MRLKCLIFGLVIVLTGCQSTLKKTALTDTNAIGEKPIKVFVNVAQEKLSADYPIVNSGAATVQFGLLGALVRGAMDASVNHRNFTIAEENVEPLREKLVDFDFKKHLVDELATNLAPGRITLGEFILVEDQKDIIKQTKTGEVFLIVTGQYRMSQEFRYPYIQLSAEMKKKAEGKREAVKLYQNWFTHYGSVVAEPKKTQDDVKDEIASVRLWWSGLSKKEKKRNELKARYFKEMKSAKRMELSREKSVEYASKSWQQESGVELLRDLTEGVATLVKLLNEDISDVNGGDYYAKNTNKNISSISDSEDRIITRVTRGHMTGAICSAPTVDTAGINQFLCR